VTGNGDEDAEVVLTPGDRVRAIVALGWSFLRFSIGEGTMGKVVSDLGPATVGVEWDDKPYGLVIPTARCMLDKVGA